MAVERARKEAAALLGVNPDCLTFTSGGTEANNMAIAGAIQDLGCTHILYNPLEHHSILHAIHYYAKGQISSSPIPLGADGGIDQTTFETLLMNATRAGSRCLVCIMHANNETGMMTDLTEIGNICRRYNAIYLADCVCTIGHLPLSLSDLPIDFATAAAHKLHGPKGVGLLYTRRSLDIHPLIHGGGQERGRRAGTENVTGIVGMVRALAITQRDYDTDSPRIRELRHRLLRGLQDRIPSARINSHPMYGLYSIISVSFPRTTASENLLFELDMAGICASGGSACSGGAPSHVMAALGRGEEVTIRFSLSKYNSNEEIDRTLDLLEQKLNAKQVVITE